MTMLFRSSLLFLLVFSFPVLSHQEDCRHYYNFDVVKENTDKALLLAYARYKTVEELRQEFKEGTFNTKGKVPGFLTAAQMHGQK